MCWNLYVMKLGRVMHCITSFSYIYIDWTVYRHSIFDNRM